MMVLLGLTLAGCPGRFERPDTFDDRPAPLLAAAKSNAKTIESFSGQLRLEVWRGSDRVRLRQLIATEAPDRLRIDVLSPFEQPLQTLVSDGTRLSIWAMDQKRFYRGAATAQNLSRLLPIRLNPADVSKLLRGVAALIPYQEAAVDWDSERGRYRLSLNGAESRQELLFEPKALMLRRSTVWRRGRIEYIASFARHEQKGGAVIPLRMRFEVPSDDLKVDVEVADYVLNPELPAAAWQLEPPRGIPTETL